MQNFTFTPNNFGQRENQKNYVFVDEHNRMYYFLFYVIPGSGFEQCPTTPGTFCSGKHLEEVADSEI